MDDSDEVFVIMQIGDPEMDSVCDGAIDPAIVDAGFRPRRVDRHNEGDLLKSEIVQFIERSQIIVADLTNERPNCYLEIGYAMGLGKKSNLILTARDDHHHSSPNFKASGPKIHFDLEGYSILLWDPADLPRFRAELSNLIKRRFAVVRKNNRVLEPGGSVEDWREPLRERGEAGLAQVGRSAYMEVSAEIETSDLWSQSELMNALRDSSIDTFGWPIAVMLEGRDQYRPRPTSDGIEAEISVGGPDAEPDHFGRDRTSYDFWKLNRDGGFYTLLSLFEDERRPDCLFFDTRISRITESLLLLARLYRRLGASDTDRISVSIRHSGLRDRVLASADRGRDVRERETREDVVETTITTSVAALEADLVGLVKQFVSPLFIIFDFFELSDPVLESLVDSFVADSS